MNLVTVLTSADPVEIELARNLIQSAGLPCMVEGGPAADLIGASWGSYSGLAGAKDVRVREDHAERARELLGRAFGGDVERKSEHSIAACDRSGVAESGFHASEPQSADGVVELGVATGRARSRLLFELIVVLLVAWLPSFVSGVLCLTEPVDRWSLGQVLYSAAIAIGAIAGIAYFASRDVSWRRTLGLGKPRLLAELSWGVVLLVVCFVVTVMVYVAGRRLGLPDWPHRTYTHEEPSLAVKLVLPLMLLLAALAEELCYRALLWNRLTRLTGRPMLSVAVCSCLFAIVHVYSLVPTLSLFLHAIMFGTLFWWRRSLWSLVLTHWLWNLTLMHT